MKIKYIFLTAALTACCQVLFAEGNEHLPQGKNSVYAEYSAMVFTRNSNHDSKNGFAIGYGRTFGLTKKIPLFLETGLKIRYIHDNTNYSLYSEGEYVETKTTFNMLTAIVPITIGYNFPIAKTGISIAPYAGTALKYNFYGKMKSNGETIDMFGDKMEYPCKRFRIAAIGGFKVQYKFIYAGFYYGIDLNKFQKDVRISTFNWTLGYKF